MNKIFYLIITQLLILSCTQTAIIQEQSDNENKQSVNYKDSSEVRVYYFHGKHRCSDCLEMEQIAKETVEKNFSNNNKVIFKDIDFTDSRNDTLVEKYKISWSSILIESKNKYLNLTEESYLKTSKDTSNLSEIITTTINEYLKQN